MSEIEKLYELGNIGPFIHYQPVKDYNFGGDNGYKYNEVKYSPPFTAEKVLKVIVFFLNKGIRLEFSVEENTKISVENFKECIAQIGAKYWKSLTPEEKQQVKGILE